MCTGPKSRRRYYSELVQAWLGVLVLNGLLFWTIFSQWQKSNTFGVLIMAVIGLPTMVISVWFVALSRDSFRSYRQYLRDYEKGDDEARWP